MLFFSFGNMLILLGGLIFKWILRIIVVLVRSPGYSYHFMCNLKAPRLNEVYWLKVNHLSTEKNLDINPDLIFGPKVLESI